jgi:hypothetical protein
LFSIIWKHIMSIFVKTILSREERAIDQPHSWHITADVSEIHQSLS